MGSHNPAAKWSGSIRARRSSQAWWQGCLVARTPSSSTAWAWHAQATERSPVRVGASPEKGLGPDAGTRSEADEPPEIFRGLRAMLREAREPVADPRVATDL